MAGRLDTELTRGRALGDPALKNAVRDELAARNAHAFAVERARTEAAQTKRIVDDRHAGA